MSTKRQERERRREDARHDPQSVGPLKRVGAKVGPTLVFLLTAFALWVLVNVLMSRPEP